MQKTSYLTLIAFVFIACHPKSSNQSQPISVVWEQDQPVGFNIPIKNLPGDFQKDYVKVYIAENKFDKAIFGKINLTDSSVVFQTLIPLTYDLKYRIIYHDELLEELEVRRPSGMPSAQLLSVYPSGDTIPENLLKIYLHFSQPMGNSHSLEHLFLLSNGDTLQPFLDLPNELWNQDRTVLTLWLDPGRVKRDLIPNLELGNPLLEGQTYQLIILNDWNDARGLPLKQNYEKTFYVTGRDGQSPYPKSWAFSIPQNGSRQALRISFHESLDYSLVQECLSVLNSRNGVISGKFTVADHERGILFQPEQPWEGGSYRIRIASILEDLAGNNLNRPFDMEISKNVNKSSDRDFVFLEFEVLTETM